MMVNNPLEIYAFVIGAKLYDSLFNVLVGFCIVFIPLALIFFRSLGHLMEASFHQVADTAIKRVAGELFVFIFSIMLFVAPTWTVNAHAIQYRPFCAANAEPSTWGNTGTTYDAVLGDFDYTGVTLPIGLSFVLAGASGVTNAAIATLPCSTNVTQIQQTLSSTALSPEVATQVRRFTHECYAPARANFQQQTPEKSTYQSIMTEYGGPMDLSWIGSHTFQQLYYGTLYPQKAVPGFPLSMFPDPDKTTNENAGVNYDQTAGYPTCRQWWNDAQHGLEQQLVNLAKAHSPNNPYLGHISLESQVESWLATIKTTSHVGSQISANDVIAYNLLRANNNDGYDNDAQTVFKDDDDSSPRMVAHLVLLGFGTAGQSLEAGWNHIKRTEIAQEIPIIQAILLAIILLCGPIVLVAGCYRIRVIFTYYFILVSVIFITYIEKTIHYLENSVHASMPVGIYSFMTYGMVFNVFTKMYFYAPLLFLMLMSIAGYQFGSMMQGGFQNNMSNQGMGKGVASSIATKFLK